LGSLLLSLRPWPSRSVEQDHPVAFHREARRQFAVDVGVEQDAVQQHEGHTFADRFVSQAMAVVVEVVLLEQRCGCVHVFNFPRVLAPLPPGEGLG